jgi:REP-associated tyrosine transposase
MIDDREKRRRSVRLRGFDYAYRGFFFVTICTHNKKPTLGKVINYESHLSALGKIVEKCWLQIPDHFPNVYLDEWVIMPNHLHGIIVIKYPKGCDPASRGTACRAPTAIGTAHEGFGKPVAGSLPTIIRSFKSAVTKHANELARNRSAPFWQRNYFEHVIRDEDSLNKIRNYVWENPIHWWADEYNVKGGEE